MSLLKLTELHSGWIGSKVQGSTLRVTGVYVTESLTKKRLEDLRQSVFEAPAYNLGPALRKTDVYKLVEHFFLCCLAKVPTNRVTTSLQEFRVVGSGNEFTRVAKQPIPLNAVIDYEEVYMQTRAWDSFCALHFSRCLNSEAASRSWVARRAICLLSLRNGWFAGRE